ncbi:MAG: ComEA family DNA-binding protein, partial [Betaproteobacteria bacterium]
MPQAPVGAASTPCAIAASPRLSFTSPRRASYGVNGNPGPSVTGVARSSAGAAGRCARVPLTSTENDMKRLLLAILLVVLSSFALAAVNINTATREELDALPGIGPVKAQAIIDYRSANGPFRSTEDIMKVKGIKEGEYAKILDQISVSWRTSVPASGTREA